MTAMQASFGSLAEAQCIQHLSFRVRQAGYALPIDLVREIIEYDEVTRVPMMPDYIHGVINLRGNVVPVLDLAARFGLSRTEPDKRTCIVITELTLEDASQRLGLVVDAVDAVHDIDTRQVLPPPPFGARIRADEADEALVIGAEMGNRFTVAGFGAMQLLAPDSARPFGEGRNGLVLGEAVAVLRMTSQPSRWQIAGGANVVDGRNPSGTEATAVHAMCSGALAQSGLRPGDIDLIKVQAAGSPVNDAIEAEALKQVFEPLPPLVSLKSALGHTLGASGAAELALLVGCIEGAAWPAVDYPLDASLGIALSEQVPRRLRNILLNFAGFGGGHASLVLKDTGP